MSHKITQVCSAVPPFHHESSLSLGYSRHLLGARVGRPTGVEDCLHLITLTACRVTAVKPGQAVLLRYAVMVDSFSSSHPERIGKMTPGGLCAAVNMEIRRHTISHKQVTSKRSSIMQLVHACATNAPGSRSTIHTTVFEPQPSPRCVVTICEHLKSFAPFCPGKKLSFCSSKGGSMRSFKLLQTMICQHRRVHVAPENVIFEHDTCRCCWRRTIVGLSVEVREVCPESPMRHFIGPRHPLRSCPPLLGAHPFRKRRPLPPLAQLRS
jgi:hypothetical protein